MKKSRSTKKPRPSTWAVAYEAARNYAADMEDRRWMYLDEVFDVVRAQSPVLKSDEPVADRELNARMCGAEAGYLFGVAIGVVKCGPWHELLLSGGTR